MTAHERLIDALRNHGSRVDDRNSPKIIAQCPGHDDRNPSLSIEPRRDNKGVVLYCHAGCDTSVVLQALGWTASDLFDDDAARAVFSPRRDYEYPDGRVVHRKPGKDFRQSGNKQGRSLFHADRLGDASTVFSVEGEKDVEAIETLGGGVAVSQPQGSGTAPDRYHWEVLRARNVIVIADRDEPGRKYAAKVAALLAGIAASVRIAEAKVGKDATDHLTAGYTLDDFVFVEDPELANALASSVESNDSPTEDEKPARRSMAAQLVDVALSDYRLGISDTDDAFGMRGDLPHIAMPLRGGKTGFRAELARRFFADHQQVPGQQALADACTVLEGMAAQEHPTRVWLRVGEREGHVYIDSGDTEGTVIHVHSGRWTIADTAPVKFRRTRLTGQMSVPVRGGDLGRLWEFVPIDAEDRPVLLAWLVAALIAPDIPHPVLGLFAEQGSAKSSTTRCLVDLIDPSPVPLRQAPRDAEGWVTAASASWTVALDNLSGDLPAWLSDSLCRAATGDGSVRRALYTDSDVSVFAFRRCVIVNGIDLRISGGDLAERLVGMDLRRIDTRKRRPEAELTEAWGDAVPQIFGGLLDLAAQVHALMPTVVVKDLPRMADYATLLTAVDQVLGTKGLNRYRERARKAANDTLDHPLILELSNALDGFEGRTSREILDALRPKDEKWKPPRDWPKNARAVTAQLTRDAPALRAQGWHVDHDGGHSKDGVTRWTIVPPPEKAQKTGPPAPPNPHAQVRGHISGGSDENSFPATDLDNPPGGSQAGKAGQVDSDNPPDLRALTCGDGSAGQAGQNPALSLLLNPVKVAGPGRCSECSFHTPTQGHRDGCSAGAA